MAVAVALLLSQGACFRAPLGGFPSALAHPAYRVPLQRRPRVIRAAESAPDAEALKRELFDLIPSQPRGAPTTNLTAAKEAVAKIEAKAAELEPLSPYPRLGTKGEDGSLDACAEALEALSGPWELSYSNAPEITRLNRLPFGFRLGRVFQLVDVDRGALENQAFVGHLLGLARLHTRAVASVGLAAPGGVDRRGVANKAENRVEVTFRKVIFSLLRFLFLPAFGLLRKAVVPRGPAERSGKTPTLDITYLDTEVRVSRGGDGSLFVLRRPGPGKAGALPMLSDEGLGGVDKGSTYDATQDFLPKRASA